MVLWRFGFYLTRKDYLTFNFIIFDGFPHRPTPWQDGLRARSYSVHCYQFQSSAHWSAERNPGLWLAERNPSEKEWPGPVLWTLHSFTGIRDVWANTSQLFVSSCSIIRESMEFPSEEVSNSSQKREICTCELKPNHLCRQKETSSCQISIRTERGKYLLEWIVT